MKSKVSPPVSTRTIFVSLYKQRVFLIVCVEFIVCNCVSTFVCKRDSNKFSFKYPQYRRVL